MRRNWIILAIACVALHGLAWWSVDHWPHAITCVFAVALAVALVSLTGCVAVQKGNVALRAAISIGVVAYVGLLIHSAWSILKSAS